MQRASLPPSGRLRGRHLCRSAALLAAAGLATTASADIWRAIYLPGGGVISYRVSHMPDLDQRRLQGAGPLGLANNGAMYCAPTATLNLFAYAANHGYPSVSPGSGNWQNQNRYTAATLGIALMGFNMNTHAVNGTSGQGMKNGLIQWIANGAPYMGWQVKFVSQSYFPTVERMSLLACSGWIVAPAYGRYETIGTTLGAPYVNRTGGHVVTLSAVEKTGSTRWIRFRDPADDPANTTQSTFKNKQENYQNLTVAFGTTVASLRVLSALSHPLADNKYRLLDSFVAIKPHFGLTSFTNSDSANGPWVVQQLDPIGFLNAENVSLPQIELPKGMQVLQIALHPELTSAVLITQEGVIAVNRRLRKLDLLTGDLTLLGDGANLQPRYMAIGRKGQIYISDGDKIYRLDSDGNLLNAISSNPPVSGMAYREDTDTLHIVSVAQRRIVRYSEDLEQGLINFSIPTSVPMGGDAAVSVYPDSDRVWFRTAASNTLYGIIPGNPFFSLETISLPQIADTTAISANRNERLTVVADGSVRDLVKVDGTWQIDLASPFHGMPAGPGFWMLRDSTNFDPELHSGPEWETNIHPDDLVSYGIEVPDCTADLNSDGVVDGADLGLLLASWGPADPDSLIDLNDDGVVNGADLGLLLSMWGECP